MKVLFDVGHPSFVHLFRKVAHELISSGNTVIFSARNKDVTIDLLLEFKLPYIVTGHHSKNTFYKFFNLIRGAFGVLRLIRRFKPDLVLSGASPYASIACLMCGKKHFLFDDTENKEQSLFYKAGASLIFTPNVFKANLGSKHIRYPGFHELAYLPDKITFTDERKLILMRFVDWSATHDVFRSGLSMSQKIAIVNMASKLGDVIISSETVLPNELKPYQYTGKLSEFKQLYGGSLLFIGESATMATEAACSGTPAVYIDEAGRSYTTHIEKHYSLIKNYHPNEFNFENVLAWLNSKEFQEQKDSNYRQLLEDHINVSNFIYWLIQNHEKAYLSDFIRRENFFNQFKIL